MKNKKTSRWQIVLMIVAVCFFVGILTGASSSAALDYDQRSRLAQYTEDFYKNNGFLYSFVKHGKYIAAIWLSGFLSSGSAVILVIVFGIGIFYGFSASFSAAENGMRYVVSNLLPQNIILIPLYIFTAVWSISFVLNKFSNNGPKSRIKRERYKHLKEHFVILAICMVLNAAACLCENYMVGFISKLFQ